MAFGEDFLKGFFGSDYLKDFSHASKTFRSNDYELAPRYKFLFHVRFNLNTTEIIKLAEVFSEDDRENLSLLVKNVQLPNFNIDVDVMNQYNRKRLVQKKIDYNPCQFTFHDDGSDLIRNLWYNYFAYYYKDPSQRYLDVSTTNGSAGQNALGDAKGSYLNRDTYADARINNDWGYIGESYSDGTSSATGKPAFFKDITIYGFDQHKFAAYVLVNPLITEWQHDTYDYSQGGGMMENRMTVRYETVKYYSGRLSGTFPDKYATGFADPAHYDVEPSPLARPGSTASILGPGGLVDTIGGVVQDLQSGSVLGIVGAIQKAGTAYQTFKGKDLQSIVKNEANTVVKDVIRGELPGAVRSTANKLDTVFFPKVPAQTNSTTSNPATPRSATPGIAPGPSTGVL